MEADSLNCIVLGDDITPNMPEWGHFIKRNTQGSNRVPEMHGHPSDLYRTFVEDAHIALGKSLAQLPLQSGK